MVRIVDLTRQEPPASRHDSTGYREMFTRDRLYSFEGAPAHCDGVMVGGSRGLVRSLTFRRGKFWRFLGPGQEFGTNAKIVGCEGTGTWVFKGRPDEALHCGDEFFFGLDPSDGGTRIRPL